MEEERQDDRGKHRSAQGHEKQASEVHAGCGLERLSHQPWPYDVGHEGTQPENHEVEQALSARAYVLGKELVDEDVDGREKERVGDSILVNIVHGIAYAF